MVVFHELFSAHLEAVEHLIPHKRIAMQTNSLQYYDADKRNIRIEYRPQFNTEVMN